MVSSKRELGSIVLSAAAVLSMFATACGSSEEGDAGPSDGRVDSPPCEEGAIASACACGATVVDEGYCCAGAWQASACRSCASGASGSYVGAPLPMQSRTFEVVFEVTPETAPVEAAVALASGTSTDLAWADLAAIVRFGPTGTIDARNGSAYEAAVAISYVAGETYRVRATVDVSQHRYSVFVTSPGEAEQLVAQDFAFRTEQATIASLDQWGIESDSGVLDVCLVSLSTSVSVDVTPPTATVVAGAIQQFSATVSGAADTSVSWSVESGCGSITTSGLYTAPASIGTCLVTATSVADPAASDTAVVTVVSATEPSYPFQGYTTTRGAFEAIADGAGTPRVLVVDRLSASSTDGDETTGRGSLPWALARTYPRVVLFEVSGTIDVGGTIVIRSPYVSVHGQSAPSPGVTLYHVELLVHTHDVILQHLRVRMGEPAIGGGDPLSVCGAAGDTVHDIIIDHCSSSLGHDEQLSISACADGDVRRVTISNNIIGLGLDYDGHDFGTLVDSGGSNSFDVDEILLDRNLWAQVSYRTPLINHAARRVTVTNNVTFNAMWHGLQVESAQYPEGQYVDYLHNLYWRGPETQDVGSWPTDEVATWPSEPEVWPWSSSRRPVSAFYGPSGVNTRVYFEGNYDYVNAEDYTYGDHEGRPIRLEHQRYSDVITAADITATSRQTSAVVEMLTPAEVEAHVMLSVGCTPSDRDALDALIVSDALARTGGYIDRVADLTVAPVPTSGGTRALGSISGYPAGHELEDADGDGLTDLEEWIYR